MLPLDAETIGRAFDWLVAELGLPRPMVEPPSFALRVHHYWRAAEPPEPPLLGSFFLGDLAAARRLVAGGRGPANLRRYLGIDRPAERKDVLRDTRLIADAVAPGLIPPGRWPAPGRHPLVLLQQAAVDLAAAGSPETGLLPVNGPPGTGKTTLLRDLVAALVVRRAEAMCAFDDPEDAFARSGEMLKAGNASIHIDKWCEAEGEVVVGLLARLASAGVPELDLYVVSPFVIVAQKTRERLLASGLLGRWTDDPRRWTRERVGTVHTVQGREADSVILMLGAPLPTQSGARGWAGGIANLLNVAATRAKENLYVVGARSAWREAGVFRHLAAALSAEPVDETVSERAGT